MENDDLRELDRTVVLTTLKLAELVTGDRLTDPTPCAEWTVGDLLSHMAVQHRGFAAAARGQGADLDRWHPRPPGSHTAAEYAESAAEVLSAFEPDDVPERVFAMPEFGPDVTVPGHQAISFHLVDYVVHGWDLARALNVDFELPAAVTEPVLQIVENIPDGPERDIPDSPFAHAVPGADSGSPLDRILRLLGRSPSWPEIG